MEYNIFKQMVVGPAPLSVSEELLTEIRDLFRNQWAAAHNIPLVRIPYWEKDNITLEMLLGDKYLMG